MKGQKILTTANVQQMKWLACCCWSLIIVLTAYVLVRQEHRTTMKLAKSEAMAFFQKDVSIRKWASMHNGVYVVPTATTPPNPYLSHRPDRDIVSTEGKQLTLMNPAYIFRQLSEQFAAEYGIKGHITSLNLLRPENMPDQWEKGALERFEKGDEEFSAVTTVDGKPVFRFMSSLRVEKGCLECHLHQGYKVGEIRGGVGIILPMDKYLAVEKSKVKLISGAGALLWLLGICGIFGAFRQINIGLKSYEEAEKELIRKEEWHREILDTVQFGIVIVDYHKQTIDYINPTACAMSGYQYEDIIGKPCHSIVCPQEEGNCPVINHNEDVSSLETELVCADGSTLDIMKTVKVVETTGGLKCIESFVDISRLKKNQALLDIHAVHTTEINHLQMQLLAPGLFENKLAMICDSLVANFDLFLCRIWLTRAQDLCHTGCAYAGSAEEEKYCYNSAGCFHLQASSGYSDHLDRDLRRIPLTPHKIDNLATIKQQKLVTNHVTTNPLIHIHKWAKEHNLVSFAGFRLVDHDEQTIGILAMFAKRPLEESDEIHLNRIAEVVTQVVLTEKVAGELAKALDNAERLNKLTMGREKKVMGMKQEVNELLVAAGKPPKYKGQENY